MRKMAAVAAAMAQRRAAERRLDAQRQKQDRQAFVQGVLKKYDVSKSGGLTYQELRGFLKELQPSREDEITDGEVKWVIQMSTTEKQDFAGEWTSGVKQLEGKALEVAAKEWLQYLQNFDEISGVFDAHCAGGTGFLDKEQLTAVLTDLNEGVPPEEVDVDKVLEQASIVKIGRASCRERV